MGRTRSAFSLVEVLAVTGVLAVLVALGAAGAGRAFAKARAVKCLNNLRQIGVSAFAYAGENQGVLPQSSHQGPSRAWTKVLKNYGLTAKEFVSPLDRSGRTLSYAINDFLTEHPAGKPELNFSRLQSQPAPGETLFIGVLNPSQQNTDHFHFAETGFSPGSFQAEAWVELAQRGSHYLFVDGHVEHMGWQSVKTKLGQAGSRFIRPDGLTP